MSKQAIVLVNDGTPRHVTKGETAICFKSGSLKVVDYTGYARSILQEGVPFSNSIDFEGGGSIGGNAILFNDGTFDLIIDMPNPMAANRQAYWGDADGTIPIVPQYADETAANAALSAGEFYWNLALKKLMAATA